MTIEAKVTLRPVSSADPVEDWSSSSSPYNPSSTLTTPEPSSPSLEAKDGYDSAEFPEFVPRPFYDESILPVVPKTESVQPLSLDAQTPDHWIARDERMIRLTGKHPYNTEAPLSALFSQGFLTPQNLFYVRTHGDTPVVTSKQASEWKLHVHGLVENEFEFTIDDLKKLFPTITLPVTLVCAGNRRKEQNMVTKGLGFNWGAAGVSTGLFTGVYLADILEYCKPKNPLYSSYPSYDTPVPGRARHVIFEGADELPKGKYGTSQRLNWACDRAKGMLIAWGLNGEDLSPDHGYPLRLVVPGQIGGRMVKWLQRIEVSDRESQHHLHFFDNKLLPTEVTADQARTEDKWWYDPKYIINDLNVNAAICSPAHDQVVSLASDTATKPLAIEGYAYTGGGRRITRVEVTLDDGKTWKLAEIIYPEDLYRSNPIQGHPYFGELDLSMTEMSFSWCFWRLDVDIKASLIETDVKVITVRAMDEALSTMPRDMYWNAMSMMNSWWFRVAVHKSDDNSLRFEHPTLAGNTNGGWMQRMNGSGLNPRYPDFGGGDPFRPTLSEATTQDTTANGEVQSQQGAQDVLLNPERINTIISVSDFAQHSDGQGPSPWFVINGHVYDGTGFLKDHPGGDQSIRLVAGQDATEDFMAIHSLDAKKLMPQFHIGKLESSGAKPTTPDHVAEPDDPSKPFLDPKKWKTSQLVQKKIISHDSRIFRFALQSEDQILGLPVGQHVYLRVKRTNAAGEVETVQRAYTPYSSNNQRGFIDILIKVYFPPKPNSDEKLVFEGGKMTMILENASAGKSSDAFTVELKGPIGHFTYLGNRQIELSPGNQLRKVKRLAMIAGGSGITPIWSIINAIADEQLSSRYIEPIPIWIIYGNRTEEDILIREELDQLTNSLNGSLRIWHVLSSDSVLDDWKMGRGRVNLECLRQHLPTPNVNLEGDASDTLALVCGPPAMEKAVSVGLKELGWDLDKDVIYF